MLNNKTPKEMLAKMFSFYFSFVQYPNECETALRVFCSELTKEINVLENKKCDKSVDATTIVDLEKQTSQRYLFLADILHNSPKLEQECILTAFSMNPTYECYQFVCELAERNQATTSETTIPCDDCQAPAPSPLSSQSLEPAGPSTPNESIDALHSMTTADALLNSKNYDELRAPNHLLDSLTNLSVGARSDLVCLLTLPRIKNLSWLVQWPKLKRECEELLEEEKKRQIVEKSTATANDKLKFIKLNYEDYKDFTPHEYPGVETGYEIYIADSDSSDSVQFIGSASDNEGDSTDTAPESKQFIVKEAKRMKNRKRMLIRRSQQLLEQSENALKNKAEDDENDAGQIKKRRKQATRQQQHGDSLKPVKRRTPAKKPKSADENSRGENVELQTEPMEMKEEPIHIKEEIIDNEDGYVLNYEPKIEVDANDDIKDIKLMHSNENSNDVSRAFADLSNSIEPFSGVLSEPFNPIIGKEEFDDFTMLGNEHSCTEQANDLLLQAPFDTSDIPFEQIEALVSTNTMHASSGSCTSTAMFSKELVNSIILGDPKPEPIDDQILSMTICDPQFNGIGDNCGNGAVENDVKLSIPFPNFVGDVNEILNFNAETPSFTDETINSLQSAPVTMQIEPKQQQLQSNETETENAIARLMSGERLEIMNTVPYVTNNDNFVNGISAIPKVQNTTKSKNPLLAFRRPKKTTAVTSTEAVPMHLQNDQQQQQPQQQHQNPSNSIISIPSLAPVHLNPNEMHVAEAIKLEPDFCQTNSLNGHPNHDFSVCDVNLPNDQVRIEIENVKNCETIFVVYFFYPQTVHQ